jgi:hypothetical protein
MRTNYLSLLLSGIVLLSLTGKAQQNTSLFYLCVGSEHYTIDFEKYAPGFGGLANLTAATESAKKMATLFNEFGAMNGIVFTSTADSMISKANFSAAVSSLIKMVQKNKAKNPFVVLYYCGHGFSAPRLEAHYIPPGGFTQNPETLSPEEWNTYGIAPLDFHEQLQKAKLNHMILLDCCYEGKQQQNPLPSQAVVKNLGIENVEGFMKNTYELLKDMNRMIGPDPVVFSTKADSSVATVSMPGIKDLTVGPICRRAYLIKQKTEGQKLTVRNFTNLLLEKELDALTVPCVSFYTEGVENADFIKPR